MNEATIKINSSSLPVRDYNGQRVVTFKDIDTVHERKDGTARRNYYTNREHFIENVDFFKVKQSEVCTNFVHTPNGYDPNANLIVLTLSGYLMLAKSFTDDLAWKVQRELVNNYFRVKATEPPKFEQLTLETSEYHYFPKTYKGEPVITLADFEHLTGINIGSARVALRKHCFENFDFYLLTKSELRAFKIENHLSNKLMNSIIAITKSGVEKLLGFYRCSVEIPMIEEKPEPQPPAVSRTQMSVDECTIALGVLGVVRDNLKKREDDEGVKAINAAIQYTFWELSKRIIGNYGDL